MNLTLHSIFSTNNVRNITLLLSENVLLSYEKGVTNERVTKHVDIMSTSSTHTDLDLSYWVNKQ